MVAPATQRVCRRQDNLTKEKTVGIGGSIFLIAIGAILTFATNTKVSGVDLDVVGIILMAAGALGLLFTMLIWAPRRRTVAGDNVVVREREVY